MMNIIVHVRCEWVLGAGKYAGGEGLLEGGALSNKGDRVVADR